MQRERQYSDSVEVKPCSTCLGQGDIASEYNHRVMTHCCEACDGEGFFTYVGGVLKTAENCMDKPATARPSFTPADR